MDQVPADEITISVFREAFPRKLFEVLKQEGRRIEEKYPGIYYVEGFPFPAQIVVTKELDAGKAYRSPDSVGACRKG